MSLIVDFTNIREDAKKELNQYQEVIGYHMMAIGMGEITQDNHLEVYARLVLLQASTLQYDCLLYTSPSPRDRQKSRMPSSA